MKISFGPNDYVEMIGSGENGSLTEQELDIFKFAIERRIELEEVKLKSKTPAKSSKDNQKE